MYLALVLLLSLLIAPLAHAGYINSNVTVEGTLNECSSAGSTNVYACSISPAIKAYHTGSCYTFIADSVNTGSATVNFNSKGAKTIKKGAGGARTNLVAGDLHTGTPYIVCYDGTNMQLVSAPDTNSSGGSSTVTCADLPALIDDVTTTAGSCDTSIYRSLSQSGTHYLVWDTGRDSATESIAAGTVQVQAVAGTLTSFSVALNTAPVGAGTYTFTVRKNAVDTTTTCAITSTATTCSDVAHTITVAAGDKISVKVVASGSPALVSASWSLSGTPTGTPVSGLTIGGIVLYGASPKTIWRANFASGDNDIYTVPTGKVAIIPGGARVTNIGVSAITFYPEIKISGVYYKLALAGASAAPSSNASVETTNSTIVLNAGETWALHTDNNGANIFLPVIEFDASAPIMRASLLSLSSGNNTLYTVPGGKSAIFPPTSLSSFGTSGGRTVYGNFSGVSRTVQIYVVPNGQSVTTSTSISGGTANTVSDGAYLASNTPQSLSAGDSIVVNTDAATATQFIWVNVIEF